MYKRDNPHWHHWSARQRVFRLQAPLGNLGQSRELSWAKSVRTPLRGSPRRLPVCVFFLALSLPPHLIYLLLTRSTARVGTQESLGTSNCAVVPPSPNARPGVPKAEPGKPPPQRQAGRAAGCSQTSALRRSGFSRPHPAAENVKLLSAAPEKPGPQRFRVSLVDHWAGQFTPLPRQAGEVRLLTRDEESCRTHYEH